MADKDYHGSDGESELGLNMPTDCCPAAVRRSAAARRSSVSASSGNSVAPTTAAKALLASRTSFPCPSKDSKMALLDRGGFHLHLPTSMCAYQRFAQPLAGVSNLASHVVRCLSPAFTA
ncbi:hypothetical protein FRC12_001032 [Ceratobasidium sp. 428]|nr:hypothetical protein FRC12_001032 [Ceratobasidium sp. 428]